MVWGPVTVCLKPGYLACNFLSRTRHKRPWTDLPSTSEGLFWPVDRAYKCSRHHRMREVQRRGSSARNIKSMGRRPSCQRSFLLLDTLLTFIRLLLKKRGENARQMQHMQHMWQVWRTVSDIASRKTASSLPDKPARCASHAACSAGSAEFGALPA